MFARARARNGYRVYLKKRQTEKRKKQKEEEQSYKETNK
jgi:hypothetical protein